MTPDIPTLITKLRNAPQKVGTFGRGDSKPLDEFAPLMTGAELRLLILMAEREMHVRGLKECMRETEKLAGAKGITINGKPC